MPLDRSSGLLLHISSLDSAGGIGDFGPAAFAFADFLAAAKQRLWQVLPLNPVGYGSSPYSSISAFAGNPLLISLEKLEELHVKKILERTSSVAEAARILGTAVYDKFPFAGSIRDTANSPALSDAKRMVWRPRVRAAWLVRIWASSAISR